MELRRDDGTMKQYLGNMTPNQMRKSLPNGVQLQLGCPYKFQELLLV